MEEEPDIRHIRLINGDEIVGEYLGQTDTGEEIIKTPMIMSDSPNPSSPGMILSRYSVLHDIELVSFKASHVLTINKVIPQMADYYALSVEYTNRVSRDAILSELEDVNTTLKTVLTDMGTPKDVLTTLSDISLILMPSSNTQH